MNEQINQALEGFVHDPDLYGQAMRELLRQDRAEFYRHSLEALHSGIDTPGQQYLIALLVQNGLLIDDICKPAFFSKELSIALARRIAQIEPKLDIRLARLLPNRDGAGGSEVKGEAAERLLDLLEATSTGARLVPLITPLMSCPDPRLRARVALMIGRRLQNVRSTETMLNEPDTRVRANAVESLWGSDTPSARALMQQALKDTNQRVVANAMYGLYRLQDQGIIPNILSMALHEIPAFRVSAAWTMGETVDPRFVPALEKLSSDLYAAVRKTAVKALARIRKTEETATTAPRLGVTVLRAEKLPTGSGGIWLRVEGPDGRFASGCAPTGFILEEAQDLVIDYQISERHVSERLGVGFALCAEAGISAEFLCAAEEAASSCLQYRRADDCWASLKLFSDDRSVPFVWHDAKVKLQTDELIELPRYIIQSEPLRQAIAAAPVRSGANPAALDALRMLLPGISVVQGQRHLIVFAGAELAAASDLHLVAKAAMENRVAIHAVTPGVRLPALESFCRSTGGTAIAARSAENLGDAYKQIYMGLIDRYEITYSTRAKLTLAPPPDPSSIRLRIFTPEGYGECHVPSEKTI